MAPRAVLEQTANRMIEAYEDYTLESLMSIRSPDCVNVILPATAAVPEMTNEQYRDWFRPMIDVIRNFRLQKLRLTIDTELNQCSMHLKSTAESDLGPYAGEYIITLTMTDDGKLIKRFEEFADMTYAEKHIVPLRRLIRKRSKQGHL